MRTKEQHLTEIERAHALVKDALAQLVLTRRNVPMQSSVYQRLARSANELYAIRRDLELTFQALQQNGYGTEGDTRDMDTEQSMEVRALGQTL